MSDYKQYMQLALQEAKKAWGRTSPNPMVGAVVVDIEGHVVGKGYHKKAGTDHAEVAAIKDSGGNTAGNTMYVTLEPCSTYGRTPPCTKAIIDAGIKKVVIGCLDPNPDHAGNAVEILHAAGIEVIFAVCEKECQLLNEDFFFWIQHKRPFVTLKMAMTLDGKIATHNGVSQWITGPDAREYVQKMRQQCDAIMVGGETVRQDNPSLTVRNPKNWWKQPERYIWTRKNAADFPAGLKIWNDKEPAFISADTSEEWLEQLQKMGEKHIMSLLVEGGGELAASMIQNGVVNKVEFFIAPKILGGKNSRSVVAGLDLDSLDEAKMIANMTAKQIGCDVLITGYCTKVYGLAE